MRRLWIVARQEYLLKVRTKAFIIGTILVPILMGALTVLPALFMNMDVSKPADFAVVDDTGTLLEPLGRALNDTTKTGERLYHLVAEEVAGRSREQLVRDLGDRVARGELGGYLLIPATVADSGKVAFYAENVSDFRRLEALDNAIESAVREVRIRRTNLDPSVVGEVLRGVPLETFKVGKTGEARKDTGVTFGLAYVIGFVFYLSLFIYGTMMLRAALEEKTSRSAEVMVATVRPSILMAGKILGIGGVGLTQIGAWVILAWLIGNSAGGMLGSAGSEILSQVGVTFPMVFFFVVYFLLGFMLYASLFGAIGAMVNSETEAQQIQTPVSMPIILAFMLMFLAIRDPNGTLVRVCSLIPLFSPILMTVRITVQMPAPWEIVASLAILMLSIWGTMWVAGRVFRVGLLMYGKRPNLPELLKWIRLG